MRTSYDVSGRACAASSSASSSRTSAVCTRSSPRHAPSSVGVSSSTLVGVGDDMAESIATLIARAIRFAGVVARPSPDYAFVEGRVAALAAAARLEDSLALTLPAAPARASLRALAAAVVATLAVAAPAYATDPEVANFDARPAGAATTPPAAEQARDRLRDRLGRFGALSLDEQTGTVRTVGRLDGFLTGPSARDGAAVALDYVRDHVAAFGLDGNDLQGLRLTDRSFVDGVEHISWEQRYRGIPVADAGLEAAITGSGRLVNVTGPPASDLAVRSAEPSLGAADAYAAARESGGDPQPTVDVAAREGGDVQVPRFDDGGRASLTLYHASS